MALLLGCIADDITGATDIALTLANGGMRVVQVLGTPASGNPIEADAVVVAQKTRSLPPAEAAAQSLAALRWLQAQKCEQFFFKYCSTFDSTPEGNIGPVIDTLLDELGQSYTIACPAFPQNGRTVFNGHLFVHDQLLSESSMRNHPLTPMRDSNLARVLTPQLRSPATVGTIRYDTVRRGPVAIGHAMAAEAKQHRCSIVDACENDHLVSIAEAARSLPLITGGSALAMGLPANHRASGLLTAKTNPVRLYPIPGPAAFIAGSCSQATRTQVQKTLGQVSGVAVDPLAIADGSQTLSDLLTEWEHHREDEAFLIYSTNDPDSVASVQSTLGVEKAAGLVETTLADFAKSLADRGVRKFVVAGGETSGAVTRTLQVKSLSIGPEIAPGVPWTIAHHEPSLLLAFKSGNFGGEDFFMDAIRKLP